MKTRMTMLLFGCLCMAAVGAGCTKVLPTKRVVIEEQSLLPDKSDADWESASGSHQATFDENKKRNP